LRLKFLDPEIYLVEVGFAHANFYLRRFEVALSWANKSLPTSKYDLAMMAAMWNFAMLGRVEDAQMMQARRRQIRVVRTLSQIRLNISHY
jgi:hypothetical protein